MKIIIETESFNGKRKSQPWIAIVDFQQCARGVFAFGEWAGDAKNGSEGTLVIEAEAGDIIADGQKDNRNLSHSRSNFHVVLPNGDLHKIGDKGKAFKAHLNGIFNYIDTIAPSPDKLLEEKEKLERRIIEIDKLLEFGEAE